MSKSTNRATIGETQLASGTGRWNQHSKLPFPEFLFVTTSDFLFALHGAFLCSEMYSISYSFETNAMQSQAEFSVQYLICDTNVLNIQNLIVIFEQILDIIDYSCETCL